MLGNLHTVTYICALENIAKELKIDILPTDTDINPGGFHDDLDVMARCFPLWEIKKNKHNELKRNSILIRRTCFELGPEFVAEILTHELLHYILGHIRGSAKEERKLDLTASEVQAQRATVISLRRFRLPFRHAKSYLKKYKNLARKRKISVGAIPKMDEEINNFIAKLVLAYDSIGDIVAHIKQKKSILFV